MIHLKRWIVGLFAISLAVGIVFSIYMLMTYVPAVFRVAILLGFLSYVVGWVIYE